MKGVRIKRPPSLKIMHSVLSVLRVNSFFSQYFSSVLSILCIPSSVSENKTISSAQKSELGWSSIGLVDFMSSSKVAEGQKGIY